MRCFIGQYIGVMDTPTDDGLNLVLDELAYVDAIGFADGDERGMDLRIQFGANVLTLQRHGLSETKMAKKNETCHLGGLKGIYVCPDLMARDCAIDRLLHGYNVFGGYDGAQMQPIVNMLLLDLPAHDSGDAPRQFCLASSCLDGTRDDFRDGFLCHGANGTQPRLCLQQPRLLGTLQQPLYIQGMTYGKRLETARLHRKLDQATLAARVKELMSKAGLDITAVKISQQTVSKAERSVNRSAYSSWFATALDISFDWLESEIGEMIVKKVDSIAPLWPFGIDEIRFLRLSDAQRKLVERTLVAMIEGFESEAEVRPPKKTKKRLR